MRKIFERLFGTKRIERLGEVFRIRQKKGSFQIGDEVVVLHAISASDMFGEECIIPTGTKGLITDKNVTTTCYDIKYEPNVEMTYGDKKRILLSLYTKKIQTIQ